MDLVDWAIPQFQKLLPLDEESIREVIEYTNTLSKDSAAEHLKNLLGETPQAANFISLFNTWRLAPESQVASPSIPQSTNSKSARPEEELTGVPRVKRKEKKVSKFNKLPPPRRPEDHGNVAGGYIKKDEEDYMAASSKHSKQQHTKEPRLAMTLALQERPDALQVPLPASGPSTAPQSRNHSPKPPPSASGPLISDLLPNVKSRTVSPAPPKAQQKLKVNITGGTPMHGASTATSDLDYAIRALEAQTNPSLTPSTAENARRRCTCMATRHPLLEAAPNCMNCGKIICVKEGLGPCTFCSHALLTGTELQTMVRVLREERGKERMDANNAVHRRAEVAQAPRPFAAKNSLGATAGAAAALLKPGFEATPASTSPNASSANASDAEDATGARLRMAKEHRDRLLTFQAQNARRTTIRDEAADFDTPSAGLSMWSSPQERALQLKRQQKVLREQEWNARPEWEKRRVVASIDVVGGKVVRRMEKVARPHTPPSSPPPDAAEVTESDAAPSGGGGGGAFSRNPLLGELIRPTARTAADPAAGERTHPTRSAWRRLQDDETDNEQWILDGGTYGPSKLAGDEPNCRVDPVQLYE